MKALRSGRLYLAGGAAALAILAAGAGLHPATAAQRGQAGVDDGVQVLLRGPVHEAFAEAVTFDPQPGVVVPRRPPDPIEESPPDQRPAGDNVTWIPGYWAWDDERSDFLWVSGTWRNLPPGRQWVSGYWGQSTRGFQWISGYWADAAAEQIEYLPEPPATVESGPNLAAPSADHSWIPGCWVWQQGRFAWRPGYWAQAHPDWTWVPAHYVWSPRGYVFVDGYWDYAIARRGVLFAPVYFRSPVYTQRSYSYSPRTAISLSVLASHLFVRPSYQHYYFGDYYGTNYSTAGYYPSFSFHSSRSGYDPVYAEQRWRNSRRRVGATQAGGIPTPPRSTIRPAAAHLGGPAGTDAARTLAPRPELHRRGTVRGIEPRTFPGVSNYDQRRAPGFGPALASLPRTHRGAARVGKQRGADSG